MSGEYFSLKKTNIMCEFRIVGDDFDPQMITEKLQIHPTQSWRKGEKTGHRDSERTFSDWGWSTGYEESYDVDDQIKKVLDIFCCKKSELIDLNKDAQLEYKIELAINIMSNEEPAIYLEKEIISFCNELDISLDFDLYIF